MSIYTCIKALHEFLKRCSLFLPTCLPQWLRLFFTGCGVCVCVSLHARVAFHSILFPPDTASMRKILHISFLIHFKRITKYNTHTHTHAHTQLHNKIEIEYIQYGFEWNFRKWVGDWVARRWGERLMRIESFIFPHLYIPAAYFIFSVYEFKINRSKGMSRKRKAAANCVCVQCTKKRYMRGKEWKE